ncbi:carbamoyltransferase C-terminal domain-containing protein [Qaidamihabitans albus]|uniref:carbamoyltransferase C-terminal domain-containing protein n=1 Tax=Qaidamihabitans albus TaxID=2795733 RepID=UPI0018F1620A|nr:carbamoyltransferase C-terminal domain-containing protein [Qaidamihabitans albus]
MLVAAFKPGHDGGVAVIDDRRLELSLESEKDSFPRNSAFTPSTLLGLAERVGAPPDVVAVGGWQTGRQPIAAGYHGVDEPVRRRTSWFGHPAEYFSSSHVRSHIMMALGMAPRLARPQEQAVLVWEGVTGSFYLVDEHFRVRREIPVLSAPGARYAFLFALADPTFPDRGAVPDLGVSGKLMALAAYGEADERDPAIAGTVEGILSMDDVYPAPKEAFRDSPVYNAGVESEVAKHAAALLTERIYQIFAQAAKEELPPGIPLRISGGCGLNCDWNERWRRDGYFSSVFVPPCTNDSGSAIGTAIDALCTIQGDPHIGWDVYSGLEFQHDRTPDPARWTATRLDHRELAGALARGRIVAWVQGRWEIGPRALGNRSLLAEPFHPGTRDRLNAIKQREDYRPIAPCCREEDLDMVFATPLRDPYMLYFQRLRSAEFGAVTHVDGTARAQTVGAVTNGRLHELLTAFADECGTGMLCNTSLNFNGSGFINRMSDLVEYCESRSLTDMVVGDTWYRRRQSS